jgi:hypothetical protein
LGTRKRGLGQKVQQKKDDGRFFLSHLFFLFFFSSCSYRCFYCAGQYDSAADFGALSSRLSSLELKATAHRMFYLSVPPSVFIEATKTAQQVQF